MNTLPIGLGLYPSASVHQLVARLGPPVNGTPVMLVMGTDSAERHDAAAVLAGLGYDVTRRRWEPDNAQIQWNATPESESLRWYGLILGGLNPAAFRHIYKRTLGPNEYVGGDPARFDWACAFEVALCKLLHAAGIAYAALSVAVGNIDPIPFATTFAPINRIADAVCYHLYAKPGNITLEGLDQPYWARRPLTWMQECRKRGVPFPALFGGESGTYQPWTDLHLGEDAYVTLAGQISGLLASWRVLGMPIIGHCLFAYGAEGTMGTQWNIDSAGLDALRVFNATADDKRIDTAPPGIKPMADFTSPNHDGPRIVTLGCVIHSTRGGAASLQAEYDATVAWFENPASAVSAHATIGPNGQVHRSVKPELIAWHCRAANETHLGLEMVQPHHGDPIPADVLDSAARVVAAWHRQFQFPLHWDTSTGLVQHRSRPEGIGDGKTDVDAPFDEADFLARVLRFTTPPLNRSEVGTYATWVLASLANGPEEVRGTVGLARFTAQLKAIGADSATPGRYGWPIPPPVV